MPATHLAMNDENDIRQSAVWITWFGHRRTASLCEAWRIPLEVIDVSEIDGWRRRLRQSMLTVRRLLSAKEDLVFVQNPSLGLTVIACVLRKFRQFRLIVDGYNEGVQPFNRSGRLIEMLTRWLLRTADVTIVTNEQLARLVAAAGGTPLVLPDALPRLDQPAPVRLPARRATNTCLVFVIATFAPDEPIDAIIEAARAMENAADFVFSGDPSRADPELFENMPANVALAGFLPEECFLGYMQAAVCVIDLSLKPDCLVCGAYEALSIGRPAVLTDCPAARDLFVEGMEFVDNSAHGIERAVRKIAANPENYAAAVRRCARAYRATWRNLASKASAAIGSLAA